MAGPPRVGLAGLDQPELGVEADGLEQPEPSGPVVVDDHAAVHQRSQHVDGRRRPALGTDELLDPFEPEPAGEHREAPEQAPLVVVEQVVAPVERRAQRLLARQRGAAAAGEQAEAVVEPRGDLLDRQRARPARPPARCASGMPSSRRQISATAGGVPPARRAKAAGRRARSTNRRTASTRRARHGRRRRAAAPATARARSPRRRRRSGSRLVARTRSVGAAAEQRARPARRTPSSRCSQLSSTSSSCALRQWASTRSSAERRVALVAVEPSAAATAAAAPARRSTSGARSTKSTPSARLGEARRATRGPAASCRRRRSR